MTWILIWFQKINRHWIKILVIRSYHLCRRNTRVSPSSSWFTPRLDGVLYGCHMLRCLAPHTRLDASRQQAALHQLGINGKPGTDLISEKEYDWPDTVTLIPVDSLACTSKLKHSNRCNTRRKTRRLVEPVHYPEVVLFLYTSICFARKLFEMENFRSSVLQTSMFTFGIRYRRIYSWGGVIADTVQCCQLHKHREF